MSFEVIITDVFYCCNNAVVIRNVIKTNLSERLILKTIIL